MKSYRFVDSNLKKSLIKFFFLESIENVNVRQ